MKFSERLGITNRELIKENMTSEIRNRVWNTIVIYLENSFALSTLHKKLIIIYDKCFKSSISTVKLYSNDNIVIQMTKLFHKFDWYQIYDFIEDILSSSALGNIDQLSTDLNIILKEENSSYRIINNQVVEITSDDEVAEIEEAIDAGFEGVKIHLSQAVAILSNREKPDYRNVIKESISAVESICQIITNDKKATLGNALDKIEEEYKIHSALKDGFKKIYGYTSDGDGIRHSLTEKTENLTLTDAKFMLIACSAFVNYLIGKIADLGIEIENE